MSTDAKCHCQLAGLLYDTRECLLYEKSDWIDAEWPNAATLIATFQFCLCENNRGQTTLSRKVCAFIHFASRL